MTYSRTAVTAIGESLVDVVLPADGGLPVEHPGGSPMNIAFGLARLDRPVTLVTHIGRDARATTIARHLTDAGVTLAPGSVREERTSTATAHLNADGSADYVFDLRWSLPPDLTADSLALTGAQLVHVGSIGAFLEPGGSDVLSLVTQLTRGEKPPLVSFDPNIRPSIVADHEAALARFERIAALSTVVKLSDEDAEWLYPGLGLDESIDRILTLGPGLVAVTRGGDGALLATSAVRRAVPGVTVRVADTIGAGDSFMSALLDSLAELLDEGVRPEELRSGRALDAQLLATIGQFAVQCAAITVSRAGANPPTRAEMHKARRL